MKKPTIYDIKYATLEKCPYFFSRDTLSFFGQTMKSFTVKKSSQGRIFIYATMYSPRGKRVGYTFREFAGDDLVWCLDKNGEHIHPTSLEEIENYIERN